MLKKNVDGSAQELRRLSKERNEYLHKHMYWLVLLILTFSLLL